jgi:hypothetical protein
MVGGDSMARQVRGEWAKSDTSENSPARKASEVVLGGPYLDAWRIWSAPEVSLPLHRRTPTGAPAGSG